MQASLKALQLALFLNLNFCSSGWIHFSYSLAMAKTDFLIPTNIKTGPNFLSLYAVEAMAWFLFSGK